MRTRALSLWIAGSLSLGLLASAPAQAVEVKIATESNRYEADLGSRVLSVANSAIIHVAITDQGVGVGTLGASIGNGTFSVSLPAGWLFAVSSAPPLACGFTTTEFINGGTGLYLIRVVPFQPNAACVWRAGEYPFYVNINTASYQGWALGKLVVN
jgi:hypothetical protein